MNNNTSRTYTVQPGSRYPTGVDVTDGGVNFSIYSRHATRVELLLFRTECSKSPFQVVELEPRMHRTFFFWHVLVIGLPAGTFYAWRIDGPDDTRKTGLSFDGDKVLLDPCAYGVSDQLWDRGRACQPGNNIATSMRCVVASQEFDWEGDRPLGEQNPERTVIYELHVGGFTRDARSDVKHPGTFLGLIEKIPYLKALGITHVELMPVMAFDEQDVPMEVANLGLTNYWGYSTHSYFSPHPRFCVSKQAAQHANEFRAMVKALHRAGIGVILDVVFNHTAEGGSGGPLINFKGIDNQTFYHLDPGDRSRYRDYTGCGNTFNCNHPIVSRLIIKCLEYWVREMHVDGFRFDLASVLSRGEDGEPLYHAPVLWDIEFSSILSQTRVIAEAWDAGGLYQVGDFPGFRWGEWNGRYRDVVRRFVRGDKGLVAEMAMRVSGSSDLYQDEDRLPINSINFITCHDGFTLNDLVSYDHKHNEVNGEQNRDGHNHNLSWNCGREGPTGDCKILALRRRQAKNFMAVLMLSQGVPMLLAGDEVLRTQHGNNNTWCQDNELGWFNWSLTGTHHDMLRFTQQMIAFRMRHPCLMHTRFLTGQEHEGHWFPDVVWHGRRLNQPSWEDAHARLLVYTLGAVKPGEEDLHICMNMGRQKTRLTLPELRGRSWYRAIDTSLESPQDIIEVAGQPRQLSQECVVPAHSVVVFESR